MVIQDEHLSILTIIIKKTIARYNDVLDTNLIVIACFNYFLLMLENVGMYSRFLSFKTSFSFNLKYYIVHICVIIEGRVGPIKLV